MEFQLWTQTLVPSQLGYSFLSQSLDFLTGTQGGRHGHCRVLLVLRMT